MAGRRFGKTVLAIAWLVMEVFRHGPGSLAYYVLPFKHQAKKVAWDELKRATRPLQIAKPNESELYVLLLGGRKIALQGADDPQSLEGVGLCAAVLDEFARMKLSAYQESLRPALDDHHGRVLFIGKPRGHNHLRDFFVRGRGATKVENWRSWQYRTVDGGFVSQADIDEARRDLPPKIFRQEYEASFETMAGRVYEMFSTEYARKDHSGHVGHVIRASLVPDWKALQKGAIGIDWGFTHPGAAVAIAETGGGQRLAVAEEFHREFRLEQWEKSLGKLKDVCVGDRTDGWQWFADPSRPDLIKHFSAKLGVTIEGAVNDVNDGILELMRLMHPHEERGPGFLVSDDCPNVITGLDSYIWATDREGNPKEKPLKVKDDAADATRYAAMGLVAPVYVGGIDDSPLDDR